MIVKKNKTTKESPSMNSTAAVSTVMRETIESKKRAYSEVTNDDDDDDNDEEPNHRNREVVPNDGGKISSCCVVNEGTSPTNDANEDPLLNFQPLEHNNLDPDSNDDEEDTTTRPLNCQSLNPIFDSYVNEVQGTPLLCQSLDGQSDPSSNGETVPLVCQSLDNYQAIPLISSSRPSTFSGKLQDSQLCHSVGRTRATLNKHLDKLGLPRPFGICVISKLGHTVSHMTLNEKWNSIPFDSTEKLQWWLGEGLGRLRSARIFDPSYHDQPAQGFPVFWARATSQPGGNRCHYIGHFRCLSFEFCGQVHFGKQRQAILEFEFVHFHQSLANSIASIPDE